ncbi:MAG: class I SAM-dependent methyltransferase [Alphaproteobacteria bacterium]|nr:MAG: class I SAM-dependent methyltransferase [Alphaproteobacteria bacterium]
MTGTVDRIAAHYGTGTLLARISAGFEALGKSLASATVEDLKPVDEFHIGGLPATEALLAQVEIGPETKVLDIGCGIGGTARFIATRFGASVTGIDLTPEFVEAARTLNEITGVPGEFMVGSATDLPFGDGGFDLVTLIHVGMNIEDKGRLFAEAARVLRPRGSFAVYDVMEEEAGPLDYPLPWASAPETSFLAPLETYRAAAEAAGFAVLAWRPRGDFARKFFADLSARSAGKAPPPLGLPLAMGENAREKIANMIANLDRHRIAPTELICRKVA